RHQDDLVVPQLGDVEVVVDTGAKRGDNRLDLVVLEDPGDPRLLAIQDLAADRQDGLEQRIAAALGRAAGGVALDDVDLADRRVARLAVRQLARQASAAHRALAREVPRVPGRDPRPGRLG